MTNAQAYKKREQENRDAVKSWLKLTDDEATNLFIDTAYEYLRNVLGTDAYGLEHLPKTSEFWMWWRLEWNRIDAIFLSCLTTDSRWYATIIDRDTETPYKVANVHDLQKWYEIYHEASLDNRYINSSVVRAGAHSVIKAIANAKVKEVSNG
jgi:hypothetical protein